MPLRTTRLPYVGRGSRSRVRGALDILYETPGTVNRHMYTCVISGSGSSMPQYGSILITSGFGFNLRTETTSYMLLISNSCLGFQLLGHEFLVYAMGR